MANTYPDEVLGLLNSLKNPRYATQDPPAEAPILFDGVLQNKNVAFMAASHDPHDYGVEVWHKAQAGEYGPIAPYTAAPRPPTSPPTDAPIEGLWPMPVTAFNVHYMRQVAPSLPIMEAISQAAVMLNGAGGRALGGAKGQALASLAKLLGLSVESFVTFVNALDDLRFVFVVAFAETVAKGKITQEFNATMAKAVAAYNSVSPIKIKEAAP
jgi:hypothetical protein